VVASSSPTQQLIAALHLSRQPGVGAATFKRLILEHGDPVSAFQAYQREPRQSARTMRKSTTEAALARAEAFVAAGGTVVPFGAPAYPALLHSLGEPPPVLFLRGNSAALRSPLLAIVGARDADESGVRDAAWLAEQGVKAGFVVVSGGASGIDRAAHEGALAQQEGLTVAVMGTGVDVVYPRTHTALFSRIEQQGLLISELLPGTAPSRGFFLTRNRIIAGLAHGVVVVRGRERSGSVTTARWALRLGRPVGAWLTQENDPLSQAARGLVAVGAAPLRGRDDAGQWLVSLKLRNKALATVAEGT